MLTVCRSYTKLRRCESFRRRVTWIDGLKDRWTHPLAVVEYIGIFPVGEGSECAHGNSKNSDREYIRTKPELLQDIEVQLQYGKRPRKVYQDLTQEEESSHTTSATSRLQPVRRSAICTVQTFVRSAIVSSEKPPCITLHNDKQIADVKCFCCAPNSRCVLGIDRIFNLGKCFVTVTTFKYLDVLRNRTEEAPIFLGPCYLHWDATTAMYANFSIT